MSADIATKVVRRMYDVFDSGHLDELELLFAADFVDHVSGSTGVDLLRERLAKFRVAFPELRIAVGYVLAKGHYVASRITTTGTRRDSVPGPPGVGASIEVTALELLRVDDEGRIAERWAGLDTDWMMGNPGSRG